MKLQDINLSMSPIESALLDFILAAKVQCDFDNAPAETPYYIEIGCDDGEFDIIGAGKCPEDAMSEARAQIIEWQIYEAKHGAR